MRNIELLVAAPELPAMGASAQLQESSKAHNDNCLQALWAGRVTRLIVVPYLFPRMAGDVEVVYGSRGDFPPFEFRRTDVLSWSWHKATSRTQMGAKSIPPREGGVTLALSILEGRRLRKKH